MENWNWKVTNLEKKKKKKRKTLKAMVVSLTKALNSHLVGFVLVSMD